MGDLPIGMQFFGLPIEAATEEKASQAPASLSAQFGTPFAYSSGEAHYRQA